MRLICRLIGHRRHLRFSTETAKHLESGTHVAKVIHFCSRCRYDLGTNEGS